MRDEGGLWLSLMNCAHTEEKKDDGSGFLFPARDLVTRALCRYSIFQWCSFCVVLGYSQDILRKLLVLRHFLERCVLRILVFCSVVIYGNDPQVFGFGFFVVCLSEVIFENGGSVK